MSGGRDRFYVFSTNAAPFESQTSYTKFSAYAMLFHGGRFGEAAKVLADKYGLPPGSFSGIKIEDIGDWREPIPLRSQIRPEAARFPLEALPDAVAEFAAQVAWATNCPVDFSAIACLAIASGSIGNSCRIAITPSRTFSACLWALFVGDPGSGKSPALELCQRPMHDMQQSMFSRWRREVNLDGTRNPLRRVMADDFTTESLFTMLSTNARGIVVVKDELAEMIAGMDQYRSGGKGNDRQRFLKLWAGSPVMIDRIRLDGEPIECPRPFAAIVGGVQPCVMDDLAANQNPDGFLDRWLISFPVGIPAVGEQWRDVSQDSQDAWARVVKDLLSLPDSPAIPLDQDACREWQARTDHHAMEMNVEGFGMKASWAKFFVYGARLSLVLHRLWGRPNGEICAQDIASAWDLVTYFKSHALRARDAGPVTDPRRPDAERVLAWIEDKGLRSFSRRDIYRSLRAFPNSESVDPPVALLIQHEFIRRESGRSGGDLFSVNPRWKRKGV